MAQGDREALAKGKDPSKTEHKEMSSIFTALKIAFTGIESSLCDREPEGFRVFFFFS